MKKSLKIFLTSIAVMFSVKALAHKPGLYSIDNKDNLNVVFAVIQACPKAEGALPGKLRTFTFSDDAHAGSYNFKSGFYVETHDAKGDEYYVRTTASCVPTADNVRLLATKTSLAGFVISKK